MRPLYPAFAQVATATKPITTLKTRSTNNFHENISNRIWCDPLNHKDHHRTRSRFHSGGFNDSSHFISNSGGFAFGKSESGPGRTSNSHQSGTRRIARAN